MRTVSNHDIEDAYKHIFSAGLSRRAARWSARRDRLVRRTLAGTGRSVPFIFISVITAAAGYVDINELFDSLIPPMPR